MTIKGFKEGDKVKVTSLNINRFDYLDKENNKVNLTISISAWEFHKEYNITETKIVYDSDYIRVNEFGNNWYLANDFILATPKEYHYTLYEEVQIIEGIYKGEKGYIASIDVTHDNHKDKTYYAYMIAFINPKYPIHVMYLPSEIQPIGSTLKYGDTIKPKMEMWHPDFSKPEYSLNINKQILKNLEEMKKMELKDIKIVNLKEALKQVNEEKASAEIKYAKEVLRENLDRKDTLLREIKVRQDEITKIDEALKLFK